MKTIRYIWILLFLSSATLLQAKAELKDSLQTVLKQAHTPQERINLLLNLLDLSDSSPDEPQIAKQLYNEAKKAHDPLALSASLSTITISLMGNPEKKDSLFRLLNEAERFLRDTSEEGVPTYYKMAYKARILQTASREERNEVCNEVLQELNQRKKTETKYEKVERLFLTGVIHYLLMALTENVDYKNALPYWEEGWEVSKDFPPASCKNFTGNLYIMLSVSYRALKDSQNLMDVSNQYLKRLDNYFDQENVTKRRPYYYKDNLYVLCYQQLMLNHQLIGKEKAHEYYLRYCDYIRHGKGDALLRNKLFFYDLSQTYYQSIGELEQSLAFCDSLILLVESGNAINTSSVVHYKNKAKLLKSMGRTEEACNVYAKAIHISDSLIRKEQLEELGEMQVQNEMSHLELEKATLINKNRNIAFLCTIGLTFIVLIFAIYFRINLRRTQKLQKELLKQTQKAQESELMKSAFIKSVCHDVGTPLDTISKHTLLISDELSTDSEKAESSETIHESCQQLTSLLDKMLETAYNESLSEKKEESTT